jgi:hypothetical protein
LKHVAFYPLFRPFIALRDPVLSADLERAVNPHFRQLEGPVKERKRMAVYCISQKYAIFAYPTKAARICYGRDIMKFAFCMGRGYRKAPGVL